MAYGRADAAWGHTAAILSMLHNCHAGKGEKSKPKDYHPLHQNEPDADIEYLPPDVTESLIQQALIDPYQ